MKRTFPAKVIEEEQRVIMTTAAAQAPAPGKLEFKDDYTPDEAERVIRNSKGLPVGVRPKMVWTWKKALLWAAIAIVCACGWAILAVSRGERISAIWFLVVALSSYAIAYRFYAYYIQIKIMRTDDANATPAERVHDGANFERTDRRVLFGQHFAGISGALLAMYQTTVQANTFKSAMTYEILLIVVIGGIGSISGSCIGSFLFIACSEWWLRFLDNETYIGAFKVPLLRTGFRMVVFSVIIMIVVLFFRKGIMGDRELPDLIRASRAKRAAKAAKKEEASK